MFTSPMIIPKELLEAKKPKRASKKKAGTAKRAAKGSRTRRARSRST